jgi:GntR family transcriptional repressor for pyruvate dehydrogenase complex
VLAADLGVNLASVREALKRLQQLRLVEVRHGDATRLLDWRQSGGLEALARFGSLDQDLVRALFEARRLLLVESARLAAVRRSDEQVLQLAELAGLIAVSESDQAALIADSAFMDAVIQSADNLVFRLIMNSVRELYLPQAAAFAVIVSDRDELVPLYTEAARAITHRDTDGAAAAIAALATAQERRITTAR